MRLLVGLLLAAGAALGLSGFPAPTTPVCSNNFSWDFQLVQPDFPIPRYSVQELLSWTLVGPAVRHAAERFTEPQESLCNGAAIFSIKWTAAHGPIGYPVPVVKLVLKENGRDIELRDPYLYHSPRLYAFQLNGPDTPYSKYTESPSGAINCYNSILISHKDDDENIADIVFWSLRAPWTGMLSNPKSLHYMCDGVYRYHIDSNAGLYLGSKVHIEISVNNTKVPITKDTFFGSGLTIEFAVKDKKIQVLKETFETSELPAEPPKSNSPVPWILASTLGGISAVAIGALVRAIRSRRAQGYGQVAQDEEGIELRL